MRAGYGHCESPILLDVRRRLDAHRATRQFGQRDQQETEQAAVRSQSRSDVRSAAVAGDKAYFISYHGNVLAVDFSGPEATAQHIWSMLNATDTAQKWRPGGWQTVTYQPKTGLLYALMHQGGEWTHKQFGTEVWVFNAQTHKRVHRIKLKTPGYSIMVSNADKPILFDMSLVASKAGNLLGARWQIPRRV